MKKMFLTLAVAVACGAFGTSAKAADKEYQVTGPVVEITTSYIIVEKHKGENWKVARNSSTTGDAPKVGDKVTVYYTMTATEIDLKKSKAEKKADK